MNRFVVTRSPRALRVRREAGVSARTICLTTIVALGTVLGCGPSAPPTDELDGFPLDAFPAVDAPPRVVLIEPGTAPLAELRYRLKADSSHALTMTMDMQMVGSSGDDADSVMEMKAPTMKVPMRVDVTAADQERASYVFQVSAAPELIPPDDMPEAVLAKMRTGLAGLTGFRGRATVTALGAMEEGRFELVEDADPRIMQTVDSLGQSLRQLAFPLPAEPVGVGARWTALQRIAAPVEVYQVARFELMQREGTRITLAVDLDQLTPPQSVDLPSLPDEVVAVKTQGRGAGSGEVTLDLGTPVPSARVKVRSETSTQITEPDGVRTMAMRLDVMFAVEPRGEAEGASPATSPGAPPTQTNAR